MRMEYEKRIAKYQALSNTLGVLLNRSSNLRLFMALLGVSGTVFFYLKGEPLFSGVIFLCSFVLFLFLVIRHGRLQREKKRVDLLLEINEDAVLRVEGAWNSFTDTGADFQDDDHNYSGDLDLFGKGSLFQWINTGRTHPGRNKLKLWLTGPPEGYDMIFKRQSAIQELSSMLDWRQGYQAEAMLAAGKLHHPEDLLRWMEETHAFYSKPSIAFLTRWLPWFTCLLVLGGFLISKIPMVLPVLAICIQIIMIGTRFVQMNMVLGAVGIYVKNIQVYRRMLETFENTEFQSEYLVQLKKKLQDTKGKAAFKQIHELEKITDRVSIRYSELYLVINILFLWDYKCMLALEGWKKRSGSHLKDWLDVIGTMEALSSLSIIGFDHQDWAYPKMTHETLGLYSVGMGHPLLPKDRVCNDLAPMRKGQVFLITGSNMSGKSTWLRTAGINMVLAYAGAPVCAKEFHVSILNLYTSMRVRDNLEKNISSFYAELLRIKRMIEAARSGEPVFFLLDEIFKGTNSRDRHTGARLLTKQLSREGAIGMVSTHDVELGDLSEEESKIRNYHFREHYENEQIHFDYKLRPGVSNTSNAVYLMKMAGVMVGDGDKLT